MNPRVLPPKRGRRIRYDRGRADGVFLIDGKRTFRLLAVLEEVELTKGGRLRSEGQVMNQLLKLWDEKRLEIERELEKVTDGMSVAEVFTRWKKYARSHGLAEKTISLHYELTMKDYQAVNGDHPLPEIRLEHLDRFKAHLIARKLAPATINMRLAKLAAFLRWAERRDYLVKVPRVERLKTPKRIAVNLTTEEIRRLIERLRGLIQETKHRRQQYFYELHELLLVLILGTGMRRGEPFQCTWEDVDLEAGELRIKHPKEGHEKPVVLPELAVAYLKSRREKYPDHVWLFDNGKGGMAYSDPHALTTAFRRHLEHLGLTGKGIKPLHGYRSNFSTVALDLLGLDPIAIQFQLGHSSLSTTQGYVSTMQSAKRRAVGSFEKKYLKGLFDRKVSDSEIANPPKATPSKR